MEKRREDITEKERMRIGRFMKVITDYFNIPMGAPPIRSLSYSFLYIRIY